MLSRRRWQGRETVLVVNAFDPRFCHNIDLVRSRDGEHGLVFILSLYSLMTRFPSETFFESLRCATEINFPYISSCHSIAYCITLYHKKKKITIILALPEDWFLLLLLLLLGTMPVNLPITCCSPPYHITLSASRISYNIIPQECWEKHT